MLGVLMARLVFLVFAQVFLKVFVGYEFRFEEFKLKNLVKCGLYMLDIHRSTLESLPFNHSPNLC